MPRSLEPTRDRKRLRAKDAEMKHQEGNRSAPALGIMHTDIVYLKNRVSELEKEVAKLKERREEDCEES